MNTLIWNSPCVESPLGPAGGSLKKDRSEVHAETIEIEVSLSLGTVVLVVLKFC